MKLFRRKINTVPFDRAKEPPRQNLLMMPFLWLYCLLNTRTGRLKISRRRMKGLKPPFLVLGTHHSFMDFCVTPLALFPYRANYISELEGFENYGEWLYRQIGCLGTRKFVQDLALVKNIQRVINRGDILVLYPEARYANIGTSCAFPSSVAKLAKLLDVPLVTINMQGNYLQSPIWNLTKRKGVPLAAEITQLFTQEELRQATAGEIDAKLSQALSYDEYQWQSDRQLKIDFPQRAEGLELVLYRCAHCGKEFALKASGTHLHCDHCGAQWQMTTLGKLERTVDSAAFPQADHVPDVSHPPRWYEWQRAEVKKEIDQGAYHLDIRCRIESLPNAKNFIDLGEGRLVHEEEGFFLTLTDYPEAEEKILCFSSMATYSVHTEYDYRKKGQCIALSTSDNTYFIFPQEEGFNVTKIQFAAEYFHQLACLQTLHCNRRITEKGGY